MHVSMLTKCVSITGMSAVLDSKADRRKDLVKPKDI